MPIALHRQIGQLAIVGFAGPSVPPDLAALAREFDLGGVILFARNVEAPEQVAELAYEAQQLARDAPLWVSIDQEGGRVARLRAPLTVWPPMATLGRAGDETLAGRFARALALELRALGISLDYAPVLDVHTNPANPVIGDRALAEDAAMVARLGAAIIHGLEQAGVAACGKHFPGPGDTSTDSHLELPLVEHPPERLREVELVPFRAAIDAGVTSIMTAHVLIPALDEERPASLSRRVVHHLLREEMGYRGLIISDDLEMKAIAGRYSLEKAAVAAIGAGCDAILLCGPDHGRQASALEALVKAVESEELSRKAIEDTLARHRRAKERFMGAAPLAGQAGGGVKAVPGTLAWPALLSVSPLGRAWRPPEPRLLRALIGCEEHQAIAAEMSRYA